MYLWYQHQDTVALRCDTINKVGESIIYKRWYLHTCDLYCMMIRQPGLFILIEPQIVEASATEIAEMPLE